MVGTLVAWVLIYLFTRKSTHSVGKVVWVTATLPFLLLFILMVRVVTLPGASLGFAFLTQVDWSRITDVSVWIAAAGQIFFSLSIGFGMMVAYASLKPKESEILGSAVIVMLGDTVTSLMSAVAVFGTL
ncbi:MAG: hypothetical protein H6765_08230 [Candidatus Peribacteria bacterium]|nr:MAG: hypothetical protein H6765_08230 [Candidatus Peribacteria bacterium]